MGSVASLLARHERRHQREIARIVAAVFTGSKRQISSELPRASRSSIMNSVGILEAMVNSGTGAMLVLEHAL